MAEIAGAEGMSPHELAAELDRGGKVVYFLYTISILIMTFKRPSRYVLIRAGESAAAKSLPYTALTLVAGWWGIPWGPIYSIMALAKNLGGGEDVTASLRSHLP